MVSGHSEECVYYGVGDWGHITIPRIVAWQKGRVWVDLMLCSQQDNGKTNHEARSYQKFKLC